MSDDAWSALGDQFVDEEYASVKGQVRTYVLHHQVTDHLSGPPGAVLDVGGGAGHQSFPLAQAGYGVWLFTDWVDLATADASQVRALNCPAARAATSGAPTSRGARVAARARDCHRTGLRGRRSQLLGGPGPPPA